MHSISLIQYLLTGNHQLAKLDWVRGESAMTLWQLQLKQLFGVFLFPVICCEAGPKDKSLFSVKLQCCRHALVVDWLMTS